MPVLSIITINLNNLDGLKETTQSVFKQSFYDYEYIIIDGGSKDGSKEYIESLNHKLTYWISEKDHGVFDAMNKGIQVASGKYLLFLNSGDILRSDCILSELSIHSWTTDIVYGDILWKIDEQNNYHWIFPNTLTFDYFIENSLPHQASFIIKDLFTRHGKYAQQYKIIADWVFFIEAVCRHNCSYLHVSNTISICDSNGLSCKPENRNDILRDKEYFLKSSFPAFWSDYVELNELRKKVKLLNNNKLYKIKRKFKKFIGLEANKF